MAARNESGHFVKGQSGNPKGRAPRVVEEKYLRKLATVVTMKDWEAIVKTAVMDAIAGDAKAREWLSDYLMGKPTQRTEITGAEGGALQNEIIIRYADDNPAAAAPVATANKD